MSRPVFVSFDIESTGLVAGVDRIVEIAAVAFQEEDVIATYSSLVDPGIPMPPDAGGINGITDEMVRGKPGLDETLPDFLAVLSRGTPVAHNAPFDVAFLCADIERIGLKPPSGPVLDTRGLARRAFPGRFSYSLASLAQDLGIAGDDAHRALSDADTCRRLFRLCVGALAGKATCIDDLARLSGSALDFATHAPRQQRTAALLEQARGMGAEVEIDYRSAGGEITTRRIRPLSFTRAGGNIAVVAFCLLRNGKRTFLLDSIVDARQVSEEHA